MIGRNDSGLNEDIRFSAVNRIALKKSLDESRKYQKIMSQ